jgi:chromosome segregation protein
MYLKSVTVKGFKSFPDRTKLEFGPGVSVIVGPNGSGKSNVTDAVLWALGEQSPVAVRGQSMQDVIFGGAPGRKGASTAEVELVLDDSEQSLGLGVSEISIVRRLDRSGEGEYRLAGARCRLIDMIELLSDTGLGKEMHSVISQGRVESLVTSKPRERRLLIEEAAGLGKHRKRRRRAQLKLERTHDNLDRALDVEREARTRLRPLKRQAEAAELHERLEALEIRWELVRDAVRARGAESDAAQAATDQVRAQRSRLAAELETVGARRQQAEEALAARSAQREELSRRAYTARAAGERIGYRIESVQQSRTRVVQRAEQSRRLIATLRERADADHEDPQAAARISALEAELEALQRDREAELARQLAELEGELASAGEAIETSERAVATALETRRGADRAAETARGAIREAERGAEQARREAARVGGELAAVNQFLRNHAGAMSGARSLSHSLDVAPGYELAVAAALDGRLAAAVVEATAEGSALLDRAGDDGGRTLVGGAAAESEAGVPPVPSAERLLEHVRGDEATLAVVSRLLADTWVIDDLGDCPEAFAGVAVTRAGRVWSARTRELRQAPAVGEDRVLAQRNRREQLVRESERAAQAELEARDAVQQAAASASEADAERDRLVAEHRGAVRAHDEAVEQRRRIAAQIDRRRSAPDEGPGADRRAQLTAQLSAERATLDRATRERAERQRTLTEQQASVARDEALIPQVDEVLAVLRDCAAAVAERLAQFEAALSSDREAGEHAARDLRECAQQEATLHGRMSTRNESLTAAEVKLERSRDHLREARAELADVAARLELAPEPASEALDDEQRETMTARLERIRRRREQLGPVNPLAQEEYAEALEHVEELETQRTDLESSLRELEKLIADIDRQIKETFERTFSATATAFEELATQLFPGGKGRLTLVAEPDRAGRPAPVIGGQPLPDGDPDEDRESPSNGSDNASDGGASDDDDDGGGERSAEELDGVEIEITPAGKDPKRLSLLSGGEKSMTALAFLFAVFLARPCPFYILDEVEAALDDLNITRFLTLLEQYSSRAQFIVVTHQKRTMEAADSLYGVSMGSDGISKVISRKLPPAEQQAA